MTRFRVQLDAYHGPVDLLLYLVRQHELDITDLPIAVITEQYLNYVAVLEQIDVNAVGDFLEMASSLIEIKSRMVLPGEDEVEDELEDPRQELVRRLLEYRQYRDAASMLEERARQWSERFPRLASDLPSRPNSPEQQPIRARGAVGPGERVRPRAQGQAGSRAGRRTFATTKHRSTFTCSESTSACDVTAASAFTAFFEYGGAQVGARGHVFGRAGTGAASTRARRTAGVVRRNLAGARRQSHCRRRSRQFRITSTASRVESLRLRVERSLTLNSKPSFNLKPQLSQHACR